MAKPTSEMNRPPAVPSREAHDETTEATPGERRGRPRDARSALVPTLVVVWSADEPKRIGEVLPVRGEVVVGRGEQASTLIRQRPGSEEARGPLTGRGVSRRQLVVGRLGDGRLSVENVGRGTLRLSGQDTRQGVVRPGDLLELQGQLVLLCVLRPSPLPAPAAPTDPPHPFGEPDADGLVGEAAAMWALREQLAFVAPQPGHVLVLGPSGAGKERVALAVHRRSRRARGPLVSRNAATLPATLVDAELFGHARNYPNAGMPERAGLLGEADGGTLFLDEVGELASTLQAHLLRVMDAGEYQRLGDPRVRRADVRVVAATNRPREHLKADFLARFRHVIEVPALAERREDLPLLARHLLRVACAGDAALTTRLCYDGEPRLSAELVLALLRHPLELQVRALDALLWRSLAVSRGEVVEPCAELLETSVGSEPPTVDPASVTKAQLVAALEAHGGEKERVWRALALPSRYVLRRLLQKHGL